MEDALKLYHHSRGKTVKRLKSIFQIRGGDGETEQTTLLGTADGCRDVLGRQSADWHCQIPRASAATSSYAIHILFPQSTLLAHEHADEPSARVYVLRAVPTLRTWYRTLVPLHVGAKRIVQRHGTHIVDWLDVEIFPAGGVLSVETWTVNRVPPPPHPLTN